MPVKINLKIVDDQPVQAKKEEIIAKPAPAAVEIKPEPVLVLKVDDGIDRNKYGSLRVARKRFGEGKVTFADLEVHPEWIDWDHLDVKKMTKQDILNVFGDIYRMPTEIYKYRTGDQIHGA